MQLPTHAAVLAAALGFVTGTIAGVGVYRILLMPELPALSILLIGVTLGGATSAVASIVAYLLVHWRTANSATPMGWRWGACAGLVVLALVTLLHVTFSPGADGILVGFLGQFAFSVLLLGWLALLCGAGLGYHVNRIAERSGA